MRVCTFFLYACGYPSCPADLVGPDKVLLVSSTQTVVEFCPSAGAASVCNMEIKVRTPNYTQQNSFNISMEYINLKVSSIFFFFFFFFFTYVG